MQGTRGSPVSRPCLPCGCPLLSGRPALTSWVARTWLPGPGGQQGGGDGRMPALQQNSAHTQSPSVPCVAQEERLLSPRGWPWGSPGRRPGHCSAELRPFSSPRGGNTAESRRCRTQNPGPGQAAGRQPRRGALSWARIPLGAAAEWGTWGLWGGQGLLCTLLCGPGKFLSSPQWCPLCSGLKNTPWGRRGQAARRLLWHDTSGPG